MAVFFIAMLAIGTGISTAETPTVTFSGTVYHKNFIAAGATVTINYATETFTTTTDKNGYYNLTIDYVGNGRAVLTAQYNGDTDVFNWYLDDGTHIGHDFWITPRPVDTISKGPAATFKGDVYYGDKPAKGAHVIIVYGKYILDQYTNDTGHYDLTVYYQGMPGRMWATYGDGLSEDYWPNPGQDGTVDTDIRITPMTGIPTATPAPTPGVTITPSPEASPTASPTPKPAPFPGAMLTVLAALGGCALLFRLKK